MLDFLKNLVNSGENLKKASTVTILTPAHFFHKLQFFFQEQSVFFLELFSKIIIYTL